MRIISASPFYWALKNWGQYYVYNYIRLIHICEKHAWSKLHVSIKKLLISCYKRIWTPCCFHGKLPYCAWGRNYPSAVATECMQICLVHHYHQLCTTTLSPTVPTRCICIFTALSIDWQWWVWAPIKWWRLPSHSGSWKRTYSALMAESDLQRVKNAKQLC